MTLPPRVAVAAVAAGVLAAVLLPRAPAGLGIVLVAVAPRGGRGARAPRRAQVGRRGRRRCGGRGGRGARARAKAVRRARRERGAAAGRRRRAAARWARARRRQATQPRIAHPGCAAVLGALALALAATAAIRDAGWVVAGELARRARARLDRREQPAQLARDRARRHRRAAAHAVRPAARSRARRRRGCRARPAARCSRSAARSLLTGTLLADLRRAVRRRATRRSRRSPGDILPDDLPLDDLPLRLVTFGIVTALAGGLVLATGVADTPARSPLLRIGRTEWLLALGALNLLFAAFVAVQLAVLFGGDGYVLKTAGVTYAEYAREGFAQLVVVGVLTLAVVAAALRWARTGADARLLRALLASLCALTLVVLASALHRLSLYEEAFGFTAHAPRGRRVPALRRRAVRARHRRARDRSPRLAGARDGPARRARARSRSPSATRTGGSRSTTSSASRRPARSTSTTSRT